MVGCSKRHRAWTSWLDAEAFYQRAGPYCTSTEEETTSGTESSPYAQHRAEAADALRTFELVCGAHGQDVEYTLSGEELMQRYGKGASLMFQSGFKVGKGAGPQSGGLLLPVSHVPTRAQLSNTNGTWLLSGLGADPLERGDRGVTHRSASTHLCEDARKPLTETFVPAIFQQNLRNLP